ncbi:MAG TPA: transcriptional regulator [Allosphingosinicella sp.]|nr:transcriptional regulator [Allosphingosinicella sp.]
MHQTKPLDRHSSTPDAALPPAEERAHAVAWADRLYTERRRRDDLFPDGLFGEPAWDLLLAMFTARERGQVMILCRAYKAAGVSDTTGRRLLDRMEEEGLISRRRAPRSRKMRIVELTDAAVHRLTAYLVRGG